MTTSKVIHSNILSVNERQQNRHKIVSKILFLPFLSEELKKIKINTMKNSGDIKITVKILIYSFICAFLCRKQWQNQKKYKKSSEGWKKIVDGTLEESSKTLIISRIIRKLTKIAIKRERKRKQRVKKRGPMVCNYIKVIFFSHIIEFYFDLFYLSTIFCVLVRPSQMCMLNVSYQ